MVLVRAGPSRLVWQLVPSVPTGQLHVYESMPKPHAHTKHMKAVSKHRDN